MLYGEFNWMGWFCENARGGAHNTGKKKSKTKNKSKSRARSDAGDTGEGEETAAEDDAATREEEIVTQLTGRISQKSAYY